MKKLTEKYLPMALFVLIGAAGGIMITRVTEELDDMNFILSLLAGVVLFYIAMYLQIIIHEGGHCIFGLLSGYKFVSFRVGSLIWIRTKDGIRMKRYSLAGTGGQCLMEPPGNCGDDFPVVLYNMGGVIINLIAAALFWGLSFLCRGNPFLHVFCLLMIVTGVGFALTNGIPMKMGAPNDGLNTIDLMKNPNAKRAFWISIKVNALITDGINVADMPDEWFVIPGKEDYDSGIVSYIPYAASDRLVAQGKHEEASALRKQVEKDFTGMPGVYRAILKSEDIYYELTHENRPEVINELYDADFAKTAKQMRSMLPVLRMECVKAKLHDRDEALFRKNMDAYEKILKDYPYETEGRTDKRLLDEALGKVHA